jgi:hypothetical protein
MDDRIKTRHFVVLLLTIFIFLSSGLFAQTFKVNLSAKNLAKIQKGKSAYDKLKRYRKAYSKDSAKQLKKISRMYERRMDSLARVADQEEKLIKRMRKKGIRQPLDTLAFLKHYTSLLTKDSSLLDSSVLKSLSIKKATSLEDQQVQRLQREYGLPMEEARRYLKSDSATRRKIAVDGLKKIREQSLSKLPAGQRKQMEAFQQQYGSYSTEVKQYAFFLRDSVEHLDTLKTLALLKAETLVPSLANQKFSGNFNQMNEMRQKMDAWKNEGSEFNKSMNELRDKDKLKDKAKQEAEEKLMTVAQGKLKAVQRSMSMLKRKYSSMGNADDLSQAIKAKSLKGHPWHERWVLGSNFNVVGVSPLLLDLAPSIGYRFDKNLQAGVTLSYRVSFADTAKLAKSISGRTFGYSAFVSHSLFANFFAYGEWEESSILMKQKKNDPGNSRQWVNSFLVGLGRQFNVSKYVSGSVLLLWNPLHQNGKSPYASDFVIKTSFRLSGEALSRLKL